MSLTELAAAQIADPFRIGLIIGLVFTAFRTRAEMGMAIPLALGILFVAVIIPTTMGTGDASMFQAVLVGLAVNAVLLGIVLGLREAVLMLRR